MTCWLCGFETTNLFTNAESPKCKSGSEPCQVCIAVAKVDEEINEVAATLRCLLLKRRDLRSEQNRVHGTLMHRLPFELKNYIFEFLLPSRNNWGRMVVPGVIMPLRLTSVCRNWQDVAWSNPRLWSTIDIRIRGQLPRRSDRINFVREWIQRSRTLPLTFHLDVDNENDDEELKGVIDAINQCSNRWYSLSLNVPLKMLSSFQHTGIQCQALKRLRLAPRKPWWGQPVPLWNPEWSPEEVEIRGVSIRSLRISWNHLSSAKVEFLPLADIARLFQLALQMTHCCISSPVFGENSMPPITHQRLKTLFLRGGRLHAPTLIHSLTLPCLQEFGTDKMSYLIPSYLPALVERSSCPLTRIILFCALGRVHLSNLQSIPGVTDLVLETPSIGDADKLLLEEYFPDLSCLTIRLQHFLFLWRGDTISDLLNRKWPWAGEGGHRKVLVIDPSEAHKFSGSVWETDIGERLKSMPWNISLRKDGFELMT